MGGRLKRVDIDVHTSLTHTGGQRRLHANHTPILFKNEQASGVGVEDRRGLLLLTMDKRGAAGRLCESAQHLRIHLVRCGPDG